MIAPQDAERLADRDNATGVAQEGLSHRIHADDRQHAPVRCGDGALLQSLMIQFHCGNGFVMSPMELSYDTNVATSLVVDGITEDPQSFD